uniref:hypothetical protein n=1 Tax=Sphingorhabdus sp. TaxID=1902408 RepID=UPI0035AEFD82
FNSRVVVDKTSLLYDDRDIATNFETLIIDFGGKRVDDPTSRSGFRESGVGDSSSLLVTVDLATSSTKIGDQLKRDEYVRISGNLAQADGVYVTLDLGLGDDTVDFSGLTAGRKGDNGLTFKNVEHVILSKFDDDFRVENAPDSTLRDVSGGAGNDYIDIRGGQNVTVVGGLGRDWIYNTSANGVIWGDLENSRERADGSRYVIIDGQTINIADNSANSDKFRWAAGTTIMDAQKRASPQGLFARQRFLGHKRNMGYATRFNRAIGSLSGWNSPAGSRLACSQR